VNRLRCVLSKRQPRRIEFNRDSMRDSTPDEFLTILTRALNCIREIKAPFSLQVLTRIEINRAMSTGAVNTESLSTGILPVHLKKYVLHQEYDDCKSTFDTIFEACPKSATSI